MSHAETPTKTELEILKVLWQANKSMRVRDVLEAINRDAESPKAYTTVMSLLNTMFEKGLVKREPVAKAYRYWPAHTRDRTLKSMLAETLSRLFDGSATALVAQLLDNAKPDANELKDIRKLIDDYTRSKLQLDSNQEG